MVVAASVPRVTSPSMAMPSRSCSSARSRREVTARSTMASASATSSAEACPSTTLRTCTSAPSPCARLRASRPINANCGPPRVAKRMRAGGYSSCSGSSGRRRTATSRGAARVTGSITRPRRCCCRLASEASRIRSQSASTAVSRMPSARLRATRVMAWTFSAASPASLAQRNSKSSSRARRRPSCSARGSAATSTRSRSTSPLPASASLRARGKACFRS